MVFPLAIQHEFKQASNKWLLRTQYSWHLFRTLRGVKVANCIGPQSHALCEKREISMHFKITSLLILLILSFASYGKDDKSKNCTRELYKAIGNGNYDKVVTLVKAGCDVNKADSEKLRPLTTPLARAFYKDQNEIAEYLLKSGADATDTFKVACDSRNKPRTELIELLIDYGADINVRDRAGRTCLMLSIKYLHEDTVAMLISKGARIDIKAPDGRSMLDMAKEKQEKIDKILKTLNSSKK